MADNGNSPVDQKPDCLRYPLRRLDLHRLTARLAHDPRRRGKSLLRICLVGAERQVDDDKRVRRGAHHRLPMQDHHVQRDADRRRQAMHDHPERVADKQQVAMGIEQRRHRRGIGGEADDLLPALAGGDLRRGDPLRAALG